MKHRVIVLGILSIFPATAAMAQVCVDCHKKLTPNIVKDWQLSKHSKNNISCTECHGDQHKSSKDVAKAKIPTAETCATCHPDRVSRW